jgi:hypothetical protein
MNDPAPNLGTFETRAHIANPSKTGNFEAFYPRHAKSARFMLSQRHEAGCIYRERCCLERRPR